MILGSIEARFPFGLLIVSDSQSMSTHDRWNPASEMVHADSASLYIAVRDAVAGLVKVVCLEGGSAGGDLHEMFSGSLELPSSTLKLYDPDEAVCLTVPVTKPEMRVTVYGDNPKEASYVVILLVS